MAKETIIAKLRGKLDFTEEAQTWLGNRREVWFAREGGDAIFVEFRGRFAEDFIASVEAETKDYFRRIGLVEEQAPQVKILETYRGSFIVDAALTMAGGMGTVYSAVKTFAELPKLADGLEDLKKRIEKRFQKKAQTTAAEIITTADDQPYSAAPPPHLLSADFTIDARPLRALQPDVAQAHKIHLSVAISRSGLVLENLLPIRITRQRGRRSGRRRSRACPGSSWLSCSSA